MDFGGLKNGECAQGELVRRSQAKEKKNNKKNLSFEHTNSTSLKKSERKHFKVADVRPGVCR